MSLKPFRESHSSLSKEHLRLETSPWDLLARDYRLLLPSMEVKNFEAWDYVVFAGLFVISSGIGVFFAIKERKKATSREFLVGGRQMSFGPVALSLTASFMSAVTVLGTPAEVYRFGASFLLFIISYAFVVLFTSELFLPVFYRSGITSTYEVRDHISSPSSAFGVATSTWRVYFSFVFCCLINGYYPDINNEISSRQLHIAKKKNNMNYG